MTDILDYDEAKVEEIKKRLYAAMGSDINEEEGFVAAGEFLAEFMALNAVSKDSLDSGLEIFTVGIILLAREAYKARGLED